MVLNIGDRFSSISGFQGALEIFKAETNTDFYISESRTLDGAKDRFPRRVEKASKILKYYCVKYRCIHGGNFAKKKLSRERLRNTSTIRLGCEAFIYLTLSADSTALVISSLCLEHNHDVNKLFSYVPRGKQQSQQQFRLKLKDLEAYKQETLKNRKKPLVQKMVSKETENVEISVSVTQDLTHLNVSNEYVHMSGPNETEFMHNPVTNASHFVQEGTESGEPTLCRCGFGAWELTKQDLMVMEVEEHNHRLEILQLQEAFQIERIEKMRYLQDLKIRKAEQELETGNCE